MQYGAYDDVLVSLEDGILRITLNNPDKRNALTTHTSMDLSRIFYDATTDPEVRVVVLTGNGKAFSAGGDIPDMLRKIETPRIFNEGIPHSRRLIFQMLDCNKPVVCKVNGDCIGLGASVALCCDIVIAADDARIADPHVNVGLVAGDGGVVSWPVLIGYARAKRYLLLGDMITGKEAEAIGLVAFCAPRGEELDAKTEEVVSRLAKGATQSISATKLTINMFLRQQAQAQMDVGMAFEAISNTSNDHREAIMAFMEKRKPTFTGD